MKIKLLSLLLCFPIFINGQSDFSISLSGGINYTPMRNIEHDFVSWQKLKIDRINFSPSIGLKYSLDRYQKINLEFEYLQVNISYGFIGADIQYELYFYPFTVGYEYCLTNTPEFNSYLGAGIGFIIFNSEYVYHSDLPDPKTMKENDNGFLLKLKYGVEYNINSNFNLFGEFGFRYVQTLIRNMYSDNNDVNLSGISLRIGLNYNF